MNLYTFYISRSAKFLIQKKLLCLYSIFYLFLLTMICSVIFLSPVISLSAMYYVSVNGNDSNPGTEGKPFRTIQKGANAASAGDTVIVLSGTYDERVILPSTRSGTSTAKITFKAEPRRSVYMKGFRGDRNNYIRIEGFVITTHESGWLGGGIWLDGNNWEIVDNYFFEVQGPAIYSTYQEGRTKNNAYVANNYVYKCNKGFVIGGDGWIVENNEIERLYYYNQDCDYTRFGGTNHIIRNNYFHGTFQNEVGPSHVDAFQTFASTSEDITKNIIIENNRVEGVLSEVMMIEGVDGSHENIVVRNNIFVTPATWGICAYGVLSLKVYNNLFAYMTSTGVGLSPSKSGTNMPSYGEIKNNIFYDVYWAYWKAGSSTIDARNNLIYKNSGYVDPKNFPYDIVNQDPMFFNVQLNNFIIKNNSPAIDTGLALPGFNYDILGTIRPQGKGWDIGPYEYKENGTAPMQPKNLRIIME